MHLALIKYSVLRLALFVGSLALLWAVGVRKSIMMLVLAAAISLALSYVLLGKQRNELATALQARVQSRTEHRQGIGQADADEEDAAIEAASMRAATAQQARPVEQVEPADQSESKADTQ